MSELQRIDVVFVKHAKAAHLALRRTNGEYTVLAVYPAVPDRAHCKVHYIACSSSQVARELHSSFAKHILQSLSPRNEWKDFVIMVRLEPWSIEFKLMKLSLRIWTRNIVGRLLRVTT
jgi:hypothetical protein